MQLPHHIHGHIIPFTIAVVVVCIIGVLAHAYWPSRAEELSPSPAVFELRDDTVVTGSR